MKNKKIASVVAGSQKSKSGGFSLQQNYLTKEKNSREKKLNRYPHSNGTVKLSPPCPYCRYQTGLVIVRWLSDLGFVRCGRCDAALFSIAEASKNIGLTHIGTELDSYLPTSAAFGEEVTK